MAGTPQRIILQHRHALGDTILFTSLVRDIHRAYPGRFEIDLSTNFKVVWQHNPLIKKFSKQELKSAVTYKIEYKEGITHSGRGNKIHFLTWFHRDFAKKAGLPVPVTEPKGDLYLTDEELTKPFVAGRYWVLAAGGKKDVPLKHWDYGKFQLVADMLAARGIPCVQVGAVDTGNVNPPLEGVLDLVGKTSNTRDVFNVIKHADGIICPVTGLMHLAAALERPCVVVAGGREEWWWEAYANLPGINNFAEATGKVKVPHRFLHTIGQLDCCRRQGCWRLYAVPVKREHMDPTNQKAHKCKQVVRLPSGQAIGKCMDMITPEHVVEAVMSYYKDGTIPPITELPKADSAIIIPRVGAALPGPPPIIVPPPLTADLEQFRGTPLPTISPELPRVPEVIRELKHVRASRPEQRQPYQEIQGESHTPARNVLEHPVIGGKITICVLCHGKYPELAKRCIDSILNTVPRERVQLRLGANACCDETVAYLQQTPAQKRYISQANKLKYPMMRSMLWDTETPIDTSYVVWFDDDSYVVDPNWLTKLCQKIVDNYPTQGRLFGMKFMHNVSQYQKADHKPLSWFQEARWWKERAMQDRRGKEIPNGSWIHFVAGGFWALGLDAIRLADIPDIRLRHRGGDITIGEQIHQAGFRVCDFNRNKVNIFSSGHTRRGYNEAFPWAPPGSKPAP